jgi:hypothetical protein
MTRATFTTAVVFLYTTAAAEQPPVTIVSPQGCGDNHGKELNSSRQRFHPILFPSSDYQELGIGGL